jgi:energy-coupling factor transporter ATP-binding protein EcfA2
MKVLDTVVYFARLKGMDAAAARKAGLALLERLDLTDWIKTPIAKLSKGMAQKVQLVTALVNSPKLLLLDEPFSGLDPVNQAVLEQEIVDAARAGTTVVFSTHVMQHAERLCDRLLLLARGRKVFEGHAGGGPQQPAEPRCPDGPDGSRDICPASLRPLRSRPMAKAGASSRSSFARQQPGRRARNLHAGRISRCAGSTSIARPCTRCSSISSARPGDRSMKAVVLVAAREFRQIVSTRGSGSCC